MTQKILIIDDDPDMLEILSYILTAEGYQTITSIDAKEADMLHEILPDLILLDLRMHGVAKAGAEICYKIKTNMNTKHLPVILVSAEPDLASIAKRCFADDYINKPFNVLDMLSKVRINLDNQNNNEGTH